MISEKNKNRHGYRKTEIGWIPRDWEVSALKHCFKLASGDTRPKDLMAYTTEEMEVPVYGGNGVMGYTSQIQDNCEKIVIGRVGEKCGCVHYVVGSHYITDNALFTVKWFGNCSVKFFSYYLDHYNLSKIRSKGGQPLVSQNPIYSIIVPLPPLPEQKKIAEILSAWDRAIEQLGKLIESKKLLKKGLMQLLLTGRLRFREFGSNKNRINTPYYDFPSDWQHPQIGNISKEVNIRNSDRNNLPVLSCSKYEGFVNSMEYFGKKVFSDDTTNYKVITKSQFGFPCNHIEEGSIGLLSHVEEGIVSPIYLVFEVNSSKVDQNYLFSLFKTEMYKHVFNVSTNSSVDRRGSLRWKAFARIRIPLPGIEEQRKTVTILYYCEREIELLKKELSAILKQKKGLMQKLLTGEIRVNITGGI